MKFICFAVLAVLALAQAARAELKWQGTGPGGGGAFETAAVSSEGAVFVGSDLSGAYVSVDGGENWRGLGSLNGLASTHVDGVAVDPERPATVLLGADDGLYYSDNCGKANDAKCAFKRKFEGQVSVTEFSIGGVAYAAGLKGYCQQGALLWRSADHGQNWIKVAAKGLATGANIMALRIEVGAPDHVIAISSPERFSGPETCGSQRWPMPAPRAAFESFDGGVNFVALPLPTDMALDDVKFDLRQRNTLWATVRAHTRSVDDNGAVYKRSVGNEFKLISNAQTGQIWPLAAGGIRLLDFRRQRPWHNKPFSVQDRTGFWQWDEAVQKFIQLTTAADYQNWDMGWSGLLHAPQASLNGHLQSFLAVNDDEAWWLDDQFVHHVTGGGKRVVNRATQRLSDGSFATRHIDNAVAAILAPSPVDKNILFTGYFDMGCWRSNTAQAAQITWRDCNGGPSVLQPDGKYENSKLSGNWHGYGGNVMALAPDPVDAKYVYAVHAANSSERGSAASGFYKVARSADGFASYEDLTYNLTEMTQAVAIVALSVDALSNSPRRLWAIAGKRIYKLDENLKTWAAVVTGTCDGTLLVMAHQGRTFLAGGSSGVCLSHDGGQTWHASKNSERMGEPKGVWWGPFGSTPFGVSDFAFDPSNPKRIWMTVMLPSTDKDQPRAGLYRSDDAGETWVQIKSFGAAAAKLRNFTRTVAVNPADPKMVVVGTSVVSVAGGYLAGVPMGAFISRDGGDTWANENAGLNWPFITSLRFSGARLFGLSPGQGIVFSDVR